MVVKQKRITCVRCGERETVTRENVVASMPSCMGVVRSAHHPPPGSPQTSQEEKGGT